MDKFKEVFSKPKFRVAIIVAYLLLILLVILTQTRFEIDLIFIILFPITLLFGRGVRFLRDWLPALFVFWIYEYGRGLAYTINQFLGREAIAERLVEIERGLFFFLDDIPTVILQRNLYTQGQSTFLDNSLFFFYASFFWIWVLGALWIWVRNRKDYYIFIYGMLGFSMAANLIFLIWPTAPPWYAAEQGFLPELHRIMWRLETLPEDSIQLINILGQNPVAALPSHHTAWTLYTAIFFIFRYGKKYLWLLIFPTVIIFSIVYGAEHYVVDVIAGVIEAFAGYWVVTHLKEIKDYFVGLRKVIRVRLKK